MDAFALNCIRIANLFASRKRVRLGFLLSHIIPILIIRNPTTSLEKQQLSREEKKIHCTECSNKHEFNKKEKC